MYGLVSQGSGDNHAAIAANQPSVESPNRDELDDLPTPTQAQERTEKITSVLPDYLRPRPFWQRALAIALPISLAAVFLILFFGDPNNNFLGRWFGGSEDATKMAAMERHPVCGRVSCGRRRHEACRPGSARKRLCGHRAGREVDTIGLQCRERCKSVRWQV
jgi:hypothetical protein